MSVQFGKINFDGKPVDAEDLAEARPVLAPFGPDGEGYFREGNVGILYCAFHTTKESRREVQPYASASGTVLTWDGRLDNREELIGLLGREVSLNSTDLEIVAAAHNRWGTDSFAKLTGDWAISIWDPRNRSIFLAKDFIGTRHLYYSLEKDQVRWCSILDPLFVCLVVRSTLMRNMWQVGLDSFLHHTLPRLLEFTAFHPRHSCESPEMRRSYQHFGGSIRPAEYVIARMQNTKNTSGPSFPTRYDADSAVTL